VVVIGFVILISTVMILAGDRITSWLASRLALEPSTRTLVTIVQMPIAFALLIAIAGLSYYFLPNLRQSRKQVLVGAIFTTIGWSLVTVALRVYVENFANYNATYGAIGGVIALLTWMYFSMLVFLIGGEINSEVHRNAPSRGAHPLYGGRIETAAAAGAVARSRRARRAVRRPANVA
jgi:membrane protein